MNEIQALPAILPRGTEGRSPFAGPPGPPALGGAPAAGPPPPRPPPSPAPPPPPAPPRRAPPPSGGGERRAAPAVAAAAVAAAAELPLWPPGAPPPTPEQLDALVLATAQSIDVADLAQGLHDLIDGVVVLFTSPVHAGLACARGYVLTWYGAASEGAVRGRAVACRRVGAGTDLRVFEALSGTIVGASLALGAAPVTAVLVGTKEGVDAFRDAFTYVAARLPRGLQTYWRLKQRRVDIDAVKGGLLEQRDLLVLARARSGDAPLSPAASDELPASAS